MLVDISFVEMLARCMRSVMPPPPPPSCCIIVTSGRTNGAPPIGMTECPEPEPVELLLWWVCIMTVAHLLAKLYKHGRERGWCRWRKQGRWRW